MRPDLLEMLRCAAWRGRALDGPDPVLLCQRGSAVVAVVNTIPRFVDQPLDDAR